MITAIPELPPTWLRVLAVISGSLGGLLGALLMTLSINFDKSEYTVGRKYVSEHGDQYRIFAEESPGGSSIDAPHRKNLYDAAEPGDKLILRGFGLNTISRAGTVTAWEISDDVLIPVLFTVSAFVPLFLIRRFRSPWARGICYPIGGSIASFITLAAIWGVLAPC
ncbi:MAG: hypothetical protein V4662_08540 [Verrucomicrobiota bacterium]